MSRKMRFFEQVSFRYFAAYVGHRKTIVLGYRLSVGRLPTKRSEQQQLILFQIVASSFCNSNLIERRCC